MGFQGLEEVEALKTDTLAQEFDQCIKCGLCVASCPVSKELLLEKYTPRGKIQLARYFTRGDLELSDHYQEIFAKCLLCGACTVTCPSGVDLRKVFLSMRSRITKDRGIHPHMKGVVQSLLSNHNISDEPNEERVEWGEDIPGMAPMARKERAEVVYFVGCVASFFPMVQAIPPNLVKILQAARIDFALLAGDEWCCGYPLIGAGLPGDMEELKAHNLDRVHALGAERVVFSCPSCFHTWKDYYHASLELYHATQFIEALIREGSLTLREVDLTVTYHDPCDLGRNSGVYEAPRQILKAIPGLTLVELENSRAKSVCCGGGGNVEMGDAGLSEKVAQKKIQEIQRTGAHTVVTSCQQCVRTIKGSVRRQKVDLNVMDITELVALALDRA